MLFEQQNIEGFIKLLETQRQLFSEADLVDLNELAESLPESIGALSNAIAAWCEERPPILEAQTAILSDICEFDGIRGPLGTGYPEPTPAENQKIQAQFINAIRRNTPPPSQPSKPKPYQVSQLNKKPD
jgi:hypothetical protein